METVLVTVTGLMCIICFAIGAKLGQAVSKGEKIETPGLDPLKAYREHEARKQARTEQSRLETIMRNIESYDGTGRGQEDIPRG